VKDVYNTNGGKKKQQWAYFHSKQQQEIGKQKGSLYKQT
jgi:hypothetical protein